MSHYLGIVVLPEQPTDREHLEKMLSALLRPFDENADEFCEDVTETGLDDDGTTWSETYRRNPRGEWDYWRLGGRWGGLFDVVDPALGFVSGRSWDSPEKIDGLDATFKGNVVVPRFPFTWVAEGVWKSRIDWSDYPRSEIPMEEWEAWSARFWTALPDTAWVAAIDYHS